MNAVKIFNNSQFGDIRTVLSENGTPFFVASDVCNALGYVNSRKAVGDHVDMEDVTKRDTLTAGGIQALTYINESGVYSLVFGSKLETAKAFKKWVTSEVIPAIRKTGGYIAASEDDTPEIILARAIIVANDSINRLKEQVAVKNKQIELQEIELKKQAPKVDYYESVLDSEGLIATTLIAKDLGMSANTLNKKLYALNVIYRCQGTWVVTAKYQNMGFAKSKSFPYHDQKGEKHTQIHFYWTEKGREFIMNKLRTA